MIAIRSGRRHLRVDVLQRVGVRADLIGRRHRRAVEVEDEQPPVLIADVARAAARRSASRSSLRRVAAVGGASAGCAGSGLRLRVGGCAPAAARCGEAPLHALELDERDVLRLAVLGDDEVLRGQPFDDLAVLVLDRAPSGRSGAWWCGNVGCSCLLLRRCAVRRSAARSRRTEPPRHRERTRACLSDSAASVCRAQGSHLRTSFAGSSALAASGSPRSAGRIAGCRRSVLTLEYVTRLSTLVASIRQSRLSRLPHGNVRVTPAFSENCAGPRAELRPASPH